jgi:MraZ protein
MRREVGDVFVGTAFPRLDDKGRLALPAKYREELAGGVVVTPGQERCLYVFTTAAFAEKASRMAAAPLANRQQRHLLRMLAARAHDDTPDKQGRITVPAGLRTYASLERDVAVIGALNRLELWAPEAWTTYQAEQTDAFADFDEEEAPDFL